MARFLTWCFLFFLFLSCAEYFPGYSTAANQIIEARREAWRQAGTEIAPNASRSLEEQLLAIQARLQPARRLLRRLQRVGAQMLAALWPGEVIPRTPSRTADWLEVAAGRLEAWKGSSSRAGALRALEFVKEWYLGLNLAHLTMFRQEAQEELVEVERDLFKRVARRHQSTPTPASSSLSWLRKVPRRHQSGLG